MPAFEFKGKSHVYAHHLTVPFRPLVPDAAKSVGDASPDGNLILHGDNLHALKALLPRYADRVNCIYIDPPYNTGNEGWVYNDNANGHLLQSWYQAQAPVDGEDLERHDKWLTMMWPRLRLLKELLAEDGVIFVSIDDNEHHHLRMLMNEIFGERNFVANIVWNHRKSRQNDIDITLSHNMIVIYAQDRRRFSLRGGEVDQTAFKNPDDDPRGPWVADPMDAPNVRENLTYEIVNPNTGKIHLPPKGRCWRFSREKYSRAVEDNRILFGKRGTSRPQYKRFLSEAIDKGVNVSTIWDDVGTRLLQRRNCSRSLGERIASTHRNPPNSSRGSFRSPPVLMPSFSIPSLAAELRVRRFWNSTRKMGVRAASFSSSVKTTPTQLPQSECVAWSGEFRGPAMLCCATGWTVASCIANSARRSASRGC